MLRTRELCTPVFAWLCFCVVADVGASSPGSHGAAPPPITVDGAKGTVSGEKRAYRKRDVVDVCLQNQNPFRYTYSLGVSSEPVHEEGLADLLDAAGLGVPEPPAATPPAETPPAETAGDAGSATAQPIGGDAQNGRSKAAAPPPPCDAAALGAWGQVVSSDTLLREAEGAVRGALSDLKKAHADAKTEFEKQAVVLLATPQPNATDLQKAAQAAVAALEKVTPPPPALSRSVERLRTSAQEQIGRLLAFVTSHPTCFTLKKGKDWQAHNERATRWSTTFTAEATEALAVAAAAAKEAAEKADGIRRILGSADAFEQCRTVGGFDVPTDVTVVATRTPREKDAKAQEIAKLTLNFGGRARFVLGTGPVVAPRLANSVYARVASLEPDPEDDTKSVTVTRVGFEERSEHRVEPMALLHGRVLDLNPDASLFASVGVAGQGAIFAGGSLGLAENRLFLSVGALRAQEQHLEGGFELGQEVPEDFTEEIPVRDSWRWGLAFAVTVKLK